MLGEKKYLCFRYIDSKWECSLRSYFYKSKKEMSTLLPVPGTPSFFASFTGDLFVEQFGSGDIVHTICKNGVWQQPQVPKTTNDAAKSTSCTTYHNCTWFLYCPSQTSNAGASATVGTSSESCDVPTGYTLPCGYDTQYLLTSSSAHEVCGSPDPDPNPDPSGSGGSGGDEGGDDDEPTDEKVLLESSTALYSPCPGLTDAWLAQIQFYPRQSTCDKLDYLESVLGFDFGSPSTWESYYIQAIRTAKGPIINLDNYSIFFSSLPVINNHQLTVAEFSDYLRLHLTQLSGTVFEPAPELGTDEAFAWNNYPLDVLVHIGIPLDPGAVIVSDYKSTSSSAGWTFTTIHDPYVHDHPVSGNRTFSVDQIPGGYVFSIQGADRVTGYADAVVSFLSDIRTRGRNSVQFTQGDALWNRLMGNVKGFFDSRGITSMRRPTIINRPGFDNLQTLLNSGHSLSELDCD